MADIDTQKILAEAREILRKETHDKAVVRAVERLRFARERTFWARLADALPFTITWKKS